MRGLMMALVLWTSAALAQPSPEEILSAIVSVNALIHPEARSAATLGSFRSGSGALIREEYVLTIGYLVLEAEAIEVSRGKTTVPAALVAFDEVSGLGLLRLRTPLGGTPLSLGDSAALRERTQAMVVKAPQAAQVVSVASRRAFSGSWEYLLDAAIYTVPAVPDWAGAALVGAKGELLGIGSLVVADGAGDGSRFPGNVFVPIDVVKPVLDELIAQGRRRGPARPWLGLNTEEQQGGLVIARVSPGGPAQRAGLRAQDIVLAVGQEPVTTLAAFYRQVWARGPAGAEVPLKVRRGAEIRELTVRSIERTAYFRTPGRD